MGISCKYIVGIDEVGRGPIAGPVTVAAVLQSRDPMSKSKCQKELKGIKDSKKLSYKQREEWLERLEQLRAEGVVDWRISSVGAQQIDTIGITKSVHGAVHSVVHRLDVDPKKCEVLLDGALRAPKKFVYQKTIIRGDEKEPLIAAASIVAKVHRDKYMSCCALEFPLYGFEQHKGYGTEGHFIAIKKHGLCLLHRRSFCRV